MKYLLILFLFVLSSANVCGAAIEDVTNDIDGQLQNSSASSVPESVANEVKAIAKKSSKKYEAKETPSQKFEIILDQKKNGNIFKDILFYIKELLVITGLLLGLIFGYPLVSKKLQEDHIKVALAEIQENNKKIRNLCNMYIDKSFTRTYQNIVINREQVQKIYDQTCILYEQAISASQEVSTLCFLLKLTLQGFLRHFPSRTFFHTESIYGYYKQVLYTIIQFTTKTVSIPKKVKLIREKYLIPVLKTYLDEYNFGRFKHFEIGVNTKSTSPIVFLFFNILNQYRNNHLLRSFHKIINSSVPCLMEMYLHKVYFPISLSYHNQDNIIGRNNLHLVGFNESTEFGGQGKIDLISFVYANQNEAHHYCNSIHLKDLKEDFRDDYLSTFYFSNAKIKSIRKIKPEMIEVIIKLEDAKSYFNTYKAVIHRKLKTEKNKF